MEILMRSGDKPKELWVNPKGGHMGRDAATWPDPVIFRQVTTPWMLRKLGLQ